MQTNLLDKWGCGLAAGRKRGGRFTCTFLLFLLAGPLFAQKLSVSPALDFGSKVTTETGSNKFPAVYDNIGNASLVFTGAGITIKGPDAGDFRFEKTPTTTTMSPNAPPREVALSFAPRSLGQKRASLVFTTNDPDFPITTVTLNGEGVPYRGTMAEGEYNGYGPGQSTIGIGGDYQSLFDATQAISSRPLTGGDWTFLILNDLIEPNNSLIGQRDTNGNTVTIRPAPNTSPTVTFTTETSQLGFTKLSGHIIIGSKMKRSVNQPWVVSEPTDNVTIHGESTEGGNARRLTFKNVAGSGATGIVSVLGDSDNVNIRNCAFEHSPQVTATGYTNTYFSTVNFHGVNDGTTSTKVPDYGSVVNCSFLTTNSAVMSISLNKTSEPLPSQFRPTDPCRGIRIQRNSIFTSGGGIDVEFAEDPLVTSNTIVIDSSKGKNGYYYNPWGSGFGIHCNALGSYDNNYQHPTDAQIMGNHIHFISDIPTSASLTGIAAGSVVPGSNFVIANNNVTGLTAPAPTYSDAARFGILHSSNSGSIATIVHNSISFHTIAGTGSTTASRCAGVYTQDYYSSTGDSIVSNNIIRMAVPQSVAIGKSSSGGRVISDNNNIFTTNGSLVGYAMQEYYPTLADWQTSTGQDLASISLDPFVPAGNGLGTWIGPADSPNPDIHFSGFPSAEYLAPRVAGIPTDIDGDPRDGAEVIMGADEPQHPQAGVHGWQVY